MKVGDEIGGGFKIRKVVYPTEIGFSVALAFGRAMPAYAWVVGPALVVKAVRLWPAV